MGFFSKDKNENNGFIINTDDESVKISGDKGLAPHAITANEVASLRDTDDVVDAKQTNALNSLKKRMNIVPDEPKTLLKHEKLAEAETNKEIDALLKSMEPKHEKAEKPRKKTLVEKIKRYTVDEQGHDASKSTEPLYQLESVAEILKNDSEDTLKELSKKYNIYIEDLAKDDPAVKKEEVVEEIGNKIAEEPKPIAKPTPAFEQMVSDAAAREEQQLFESLFPSDKKNSIPDISVPDISDIDTHEVGISNENISSTATIRFTPVADSKGNTDHISVSNVTKHIDLDDSIPDDIASHAVAQLEQSEFDDFTPTKEYADTSSGKKLLRIIAQRKRNAFLSSFVSVIMLIALSIYFIPSVYNYILNNPKGTMTVCTVFFGVSMLANADMFLNFKMLLKKRSNFDLMSSICSVFTIGLGITAAATASNAYYIIWLSALILVVRSICKFNYISAQLNSLKQIANDRPKNAVTLIDDPATTFAMVKNSIEGDVLVAAHKKSLFIEDFMKHFEFHKTMFGRLTIVALVSFALAMLSGLVSYFYYDNVFDALYVATCITCFAALPTAFLIDNVPYSSATKRLGNSSMIAGIYGAQRIENANAAVISVDDIFPEGSVLMHSMKVLSDNNIDQTLLRAASLTAAVGSPLEAIFKKIAGSNESYSVPDSDTIKYEKNLGISGWVDNEPLFIGNRSLMRAHGIEIPSLEIDKKILRKGFFPVYVATATTACALVVIQYNVNPAVAKELHKITDLGVLLLVENCDPNVTEEMICDYFGLYEDSVKIMSNAGVHMHKSTVSDVAICSAPAAYRGSSLNFIKILNRASGIKSANQLLTVLYIVFASLGILYFVYSAFSGAMAMLSQTTVLLYALITFTLSIIGFLIRRP